MIALENLIRLFLAFIIVSEIQSTNSTNRSDPAKENVASTSGTAGESEKQPRANKRAGKQILIPRRRDFICSHTQFGTTTTSSDLTDRIILSESIRCKRNQKVFISSNHGVHEDNALFSI